MALQFAPAVAVRQYGAPLPPPVHCASLFSCLPGYVETVLGIGGVLALAGVVWGIYNLLIAKGNQERLDGGRHAIRSSLLLLVILAVVHAVFRFSLRLLAR